MSSSTLTFSHGTPPVGTPSGQIDGIDIPYNSKYKQAFYPNVEVNGCSSLDFLPSETVPDSSLIHYFHPACDNHDICWGEPDSGKSGPECDDEFHADMINLCLDKFVDDSHVGDVIDLLNEYPSYQDKVYKAILTLYNSTTENNRITSYQTDGSYNLIWCFTY